MIPSITAGSPTGGDSPSHHQRHKSNAPRTVGDAHFEPAVMGGAGVVLVSSPAALYLLHLGPPCPNSMLVTQVAIASEAVSYILSAVNSPRPKLCPGGSHSYVPTC